jgi:hypothetical protein
MFMQDSAYDVEFLNLWSYYTEVDREDNSAFLMVQMRKDIAVVGRAINYALTHHMLLKLKGIDKEVLGIKTVTTEFKSSCSALSPMLEAGCENILMLSKNKTATVVLEKRRYSDWECRQEKLDSLKEFAIAKSKNPKLKRSKKNPKEKTMDGVLNHDLRTSENTV